MPDPLAPARLAFAEDGTPFSPEFGDLYHSAAGGVAQARHVFLRGNGLPERWADAPRFTILETGFGFGLSFLAAWHAWQEDPRRCARLHFVSVEKHPFNAQDLAVLHAPHAELAPLSAELRDAWPLLVPGLHRLEFAQGRVLPGECAAHRIELQGIVDGRPRIVIDHVHRLYPDAAPDWPRPRLDPVHANRVEIIGRPNVFQETVFSDADTGDGNGGGCLATGMRVVNAIPAVCSASPGILSALDLPVIAGRGVIHEDGMRRT